MLKGVIQSYLITRILSLFKELYQDFSYTQYILPICTIKFTNYNSNSQRWKTIDCHYCVQFEYCNKYIPNDFIQCIQDNPQYQKIVKKESI